MLLSLWLLVSPVQAGPAWTLVMPFGVPQFTHKKKTRGFVFGGIQLVGVATSTVATLSAYGYANAGNEDLYLTWRMISAGTVAVTAAAWFASVLDGSRQHQLELEALGRASGAREWDRWHQPRTFDASLAPSWGVYTPAANGITP